MIQITRGDCREVLKTIPDSSVDSVVTDPPYELGFMGKKWDNTGIAYNVEMWKEVLRVLKPGGHLLSFSGSRTYHRMAVAIEDAGFEIRDQIAWIYGSGFPKSLNIGKAVDKLQGNEREVVALRTDGAGNGNSENVMYDADHKFVATKVFNETKGTSEWEGWGTALKPAHEPIVVARKPLSENTVAENVLKHGTGGMNIDGCRVEAPDANLNAVQKNFDAMGYHGASETNGIPTYNPQGRFPANLIHDGSEEVVELFPNDSQRFFYCAKASKKDRDEGLEGFEEKIGGGMSGTADGTLLTGSGNERNNMMRNFHPTVKPTALMRYLVKLVTPPGGTVLDPFTGSGSTGKACKLESFDFIGIEREEDYAKIAEARINATL